MTTHTFDEQYWERHWTPGAASVMGTAPPHPYLAIELAGLPPGTALDAGCGAGAEAIWLAERGWQVTAADIAAAALSRAAERATAAGVDGRVDWVQADLSTWEPSAAFDLVLTNYAHPAIPQLAFYDRIAAWVAPGGTLLIVGHLDGHGHGHGHNGEEPPPEATVTAASITARLDPGVWEVVTAVETERTVARPDGSTKRLADVVVRARRRGTD
ncbi:class I SAM-dependent methyltransferase [Sporichthya brevicatena]|uniref:Class I SAM-dependent methyltransferase n=1 Tax=Sporichthya brevicatena TaxID=171442 RepID=A0ABN1HDG6_9ACTN